MRTEPRCFARSTTVGAFGVSPNGVRVRKPEQLLKTSGADDSTRAKCKAGFGQLETLGCIDVKSVKTGVETVNTFVPSDSRRKTRLLPALWRQKCPSP